MIKTRFAFLPTRVTNRISWHYYLHCKQWIWLRYYKVTDNKNSRYTNFIED